MNVVGGNPQWIIGLCEHDFKIFVKQVEPWFVISIWLCKLLLVMYVANEFFSPCVWPSTSPGSIQLKSLVVAILTLYNMTDHFQQNRNILRKMVSKDMFMSEL